MSTIASMPTAHAGAASPSAFSATCSAATAKPARGWLRYSPSVTKERSAPPVTRTVLLAGAGPMLEMATMALFPQLEGETIPGWFTRLFEVDGLELIVVGDEGAALLDPPP